MEKIKVITVRMPESLHKKIREAAHNGGPDSSMNSWCIKAIDAYLAETDSSRPKNEDCPLGGDHDWSDGSGNCRGCGQLKPG